MGTECGASSVLSLVAQLTLLTSSSGPGKQTDDVIRSSGDTRELTLRKYSAFTHSHELPAVALWREPE